MPKLSIVKVKLDKEVNAYLLTCATTKEAVVIDPGLPAQHQHPAQTPAHTRHQLIQRRAFATPAKQLR